MNLCVFRARSTGSAMKATAEDFEEVMEHYQKAMDEFQAIDGDFYESNIRKQLKLANLRITRIIC